MTASLVGTLPIMSGQRPNPILFSFLSLFEIGFDYYSYLELVLALRKSSTTTIGMLQKKFQIGYIKSANHGAAVMARTITNQLKKEKKSQKQSSYLGLEVGYYRPPYPISTVQIKDRDDRNAQLKF